MKSEILQELERNYLEMGKLIQSQKFTIEDAQKFTHRYFNVIRAFEDLSKSRAKWKYKFQQLEIKYKELKDGK